MQAQRSAPRPRRRSRGVIHLATGYGIRVRLDGGHLIIEDGLGRHRQVTRYNRATGNLRRLILVASTGYVSLGAVRWMSDTGCQLVHLDHTGRVLTTSAGMGLDQPALRRAQALAPTRPVGLEITRRLLTAKLEGQLAIAETLDADAATLITDRLEAFAECSDLDGLRIVEAQAAAAYWAAWRGVQARFVTKDAASVPEHWTRFGQRGSLLTGSPRSASDPINCCLNWLYGLAEAESRLALLAVGLDPGLGILHTDQPARDSLALDLLEVVRPAVDRYLLDLLAQRPLRRGDFHETAAGQCRLMPTLARELAETTPSWAGILAPRAEMIAGLLAADAGLAAPPTLLTGTKRRAARPAGSNTKPYTAPPAPRPASACAECGAQIPAGRKRCPTCHTKTNRARIAALQASETQRRRRTGRHPIQEVEARERISSSQRAHWAARQTVESGSGYTGTEAEFRRLILPLIADAKAAALAQATGLSPGYCAQIRDGRRMPHVRHWAALQLVGLTDRSAVSASCIVSDR